MKILTLVVMSVLFSCSSFSQGGASSVGHRTYASDASAVETAVKAGDFSFSAENEDPSCPVINGHPCCNPWYCGGGV
jgi:hypothetical protein